MASYGSKTQKPHKIAFMVSYGFSNFYIWKTHLSDSGAFSIDEHNDCVSSFHLGCSMKNSIIQELALNNRISPYFFTLYHLFFTRR
nr:MAG TPA: hypothetical protein [Caudoviricetes sp.]